MAKRREAVSPVPLRILRNRGVIMKKLVTLVLEVEESYNENPLMDDGFIIKDLKAQISCCSRCYDFVSVEIEEIPENKDKDKPKPT